MRPPSRRRAVGSSLRILVALALAVEAHAGLAVGAAKVDVTPRTPIRLSGYAARTKESAVVEQRLFARALAIGESRASAVVVVTVDSIGLPASVCEAIAGKLHASDRLPRERIAFCSTHSHAAPHVDGLIPNMFGIAVPAEQAEHIRSYTGELIDGATKAALESLAAMRPARLAFGCGAAKFAANRRTPGGPVDHDVPLLIAREPEGALIATLGAYACHCTTLGPEHDYCCGDWAGYAAHGVEAAHPGAVALIAIGCGADANPSPRGSLDAAKAHGAALAAEIERLVLATDPRATQLGATEPGETDLVVIDAPPECRFDRIELPFDVPRTRAEWEARRKQGGAIGHHAEYFLGKLDRGEAIPESMPYAIQSMRFGDQLAMVFLAGEVVVDYALRLKRELRRDRLFLAAYSNDLPCYIPSRRVLAEGGYEAEGAMTYYGKPTRLAPGIEDQIVSAVRGQLPGSFMSESLAPTSARH